DQATPKISQSKAASIARGFAAAIGQPLTDQMNASFVPSTAPHKKLIPDEDLYYGPRWQLVFGGVSFDVDATTGAVCRFYRGSPRNTNNGPFDAGVRLEVSRKLLKASGMDQQVAEPTYGGYGTSSDNGYVHAPRSYR